MELRVEVRQTGAEARPPAGTPVILEVRDVSLQDVAAVVLASAEVTVEPGDEAELLTSATIDVPEGALAGGRDVVVWARVAASGEDRTAVGDLITMQHLAVPERPADGAMQVPVTRIG